MNQPKPPPLFEVRERKKCPVCGESVYSKGGIHPQCAQTQADEKRITKLKARAKKEAESQAKRETVEELKAWHKRCPRCKAQVHLRKSECNCGYKFN